MNNQSHVRLEVRITVLAYVGNDAAGENTPERDPDAVESIRLTRQTEVGSMIDAPTAAAHGLACIMAKTGPVLANRLKESLAHKELTVK